METLLVLADQISEGKKFLPKCFQLWKLKCLNRQKRGLVYTKKLVFKRKKKENTFTPKSLQGVCGGPLRTVLVYRFWPPNISASIILWTSRCFDRQAFGCWGCPGQVFGSMRGTGIKSRDCQDHS